jgi:16S rRNA (cytosine1402-N4)-methyltransferase
MSGHIPVMLKEVLADLSPHDGGCYVDTTFGDGGYAKGVLESCDAQVLGIDRDPEAIARGRELAARYGGRLILAHGEFSRLEEHLAAAGFAAADGVMFDLGCSSRQFDTAERGFSFRADGPLDMRMSCEGETAADLVNRADERTLADILARFGEEKKARAIARAIVKARPVTRTKELAELVAGVLGPKAKAQPIHPATRTFQALRISVNRELDEIEIALEAAARVLRPQGRLVVVDFQSLEDAIVKRFLIARSGAAPRASRHVPEATMPRAEFRLIRKAPLVPGAEEIAANPRARSAKLRAAEKLAA